MLLLELSLLAELGDEEPELPVEIVELALGLELGVEGRLVELMVVELDMEVEELDMVEDVSGGNEVEREGEEVTGRVEVGGAVKLGVRKVVGVMLNVEKVKETEGVGVMLREELISEVPGVVLLEPSVLGAVVRLERGLD